MKLFAVVAIPAMLAIEASAGPIDRRTTCTVTWTGRNSYGGGGPGQQPVNYNNFQLEITGEGKHYSKAEKSNGSNGGFDYTVPAAAWGGEHALRTTASWQYGGNAWNSCHAIKNGVTYTGKVGKQKISTGTVSTTTDKCFIDFPCQ